MDGNDFGGLLIILMVGFLMVVGVAHLVGDYRHFDRITRDCKERGYIQNDVIRLNCSVEDVDGKKLTVQEGAIQ